MLSFPSGLLAACAALLPPWSLAASGKPNILFILLDDTGHGDFRSFNPEGRIPGRHDREVAPQGGTGDFLLLPDSPACQAGGIPPTSRPTACKAPAADPPRSP